MADIVTTMGAADSFAPIIMDKVADLRRDVAKAEADLKEALLAQSLAMGSEFCGLNKTILTDGSLTRTHVVNEGSLTRLSLANVERDLQNRIHETRIEALKTNTELSRYLADKSDNIKDRVTGFERNVDTNFKDVFVNAEKNAAALMLAAEKNTRIITDRLDASERRALKDELDETRLECASIRANSNFNLQNQEIANLKNMINSVEQSQRFSSKTVQFGAGNVALPVQTANQG